MSTRAREPVLFVGGPWDGMRHVQSRCHFYEVALPPPVLTCAAELQSAPSPVPRTARYRRMQVAPELVFFLIEPEAPLPAITEFERLLHLLTQGYRIPRLPPALRSCGSPL